ncbi:MAG TPA: tetratricopeptide repeat protein [Ferruginibacter sp.]|jgi:Tfp pilus assembly protein PilF|nr:tetratricopeptide repeat protein [Ferruginibacter sp.]
MNLSTNNFLSSKTQTWIIIIICAVFYVNTLSNQFALDDVMVLTGNNSVKQGIGGLGDILTKDSFYGYIGNGSDLSGGRWRPLSLIVYAIEYQFFGDNPGIYHLNNFLLYIFCCVVLFKFLKEFVFTSNHLAAFIATLIFAIHPVHTEVVANIKSLDEILSLLLLLSTLYYSFKYINDNSNKKNLVKSLVCYAFALLSKENGITFLAIIPLSFYFLTKKTFKEIFFYYLPYLIVGLFYLAIRFTAFRATGTLTDTLNAPFLHATFEEQIATKILIMGKYLILLFIPYPLSYDYSYNQIPYVTFSNIYVWITIIAYAALSIFAIINLKKKNILAYGILIYLISISIVSNFLVDIGAPMGERFLFQASVGFAICFGLILSNLFTIKNNVKAFRITLISATLLCGYITIARNSDWKNNEELYIHDVKVSSNSLRTNMNAGAEYITLSEEDPTLQKQYFDAAIPYLKKAIAIDSTTIDSYLNLGIIYQRSGNLDTAEIYWEKAGIISPKDDRLKQYDNFLSLIYLKKGLDMAEKNNNPGKAIIYFQKSITYQDNADAWCNIGAAYFSEGDYKNARSAFANALKINPDQPNAKGGFTDASAKLNASSNGLTK